MDVVSDSDGLTVSNFPLAAFAEAGVAKVLEVRHFKLRRYVFENEEELFVFCFALEVLSCNCVDECQVRWLIYF